MEPAAPRDQGNGGVLKLLETEFDAALRAAVPRTPAQIRCIIARGDRFYRNFGLIIWSVVVLIPAVVGATTPGREISTFFDGLVMTVLMFGLPCQIFIVVNRRKLTALARSGILSQAVVSRSDKTGQPGKEVVDVTLDWVRGDGAIAHLRVSGLPALPAVGEVYNVLVDPAQPGIAGVIAPPVGIYVADVRAAEQQK